MQVPSWSRRNNAYEASPALTSIVRRSRGSMSAFVEEYRRALVVASQTEQLKGDLARAVAMSRAAYLDDRR